MAFPRNEGKRHKNIEVKKNIVTQSK